MRPAQLSQIYNRFSPRVHEIYRLAMQHGDAGVVRLTDLIAACHQVVPECSRGLLYPAGGCPVTRTSGPMLCNDELVRRVLQLAFELAEYHSAEAGRWITPETLIAAIALVGGPAVTTIRPERVSAELGVRVPGDLREKLEESAARRGFDIPPSAEVLEAMYGGAATFSDHVLDAWRAALRERSEVLRRERMHYVNWLRSRL